MWLQQKCTADNAIVRFVYGEQAAISFVCGKQAIVTFVYNKLSFSF